jgi:ferredoxin hydrogenase small subunit
MSLLSSTPRDPFTTLADAGVRLLWHPSFSEESGDEALRVLRACAEGEVPLDILCVEGAVLRGPAGTGRFHLLSGTGESMKSWIERLTARARHVVAVGSCAAYGGMTSAGGNPADACGLQFEDDQPGGLLGHGWRDPDGLPVINVAGCPTHPGWVTDALVSIALGALAPADLDDYGRPRSYADQLVHHACPRNEFYEFKASAEKPSDLGCLMENMGCKGTLAHADCNIRLWNGSGSCLRGGYACINCTLPGFEEPGHAFTETPKIAGIPIGLPSDMPKAWFVALAALSKSATPRRVRENAVADHAVIAPVARRSGRR